MIAFWFVTYIIGLLVTLTIVTKHRSPDNIEGEGELTAAFMWPLFWPLSLIASCVKGVIRMISSPPPQSSSRDKEISRAWKSEPVNAKRPA